MKMLAGNVKKSDVLNSVFSQVRMFTVLTNQRAVRVLLLSVQQD